MVINGSHERSISSEPSAPQLLGRGPPWISRFLFALILGGWAAPGTAGDASCTAALGAPVATAALRTVGTEPATRQLAVAPGRQYLIEADERGNDALLEILDSRDAVIFRADHPERRTGTRRAVVTARDQPSLGVRVTGKEHPNARGTVSVHAYDLQSPGTRPDCVGIMKLLAQADADYAEGKEISSGRVVSPASSARAAFQRASDGYLSAERALATSGDRVLRGQMELALAGVAYFDLQDWEKAAQWARAAAETLGASDPYRRARAQALAAAAWIETGSSGSQSSGLLGRARSVLRRLTRFHLKRGEKYDAGLQLTNIGLTYLYEGRYLECVATFAASSRLFDSLRDIPRRAQAWQNRALCLSSLGRLAEALRWFEHALVDIGPEPYPTLYVAALTNTALTHYELGHFDESLRLYDRALAFTQKTQSGRDEAYCLYGIGLNYYALGDLTRARDFLTRSLAIRTVALDSLGRVGSLRALATLEAEQGRPEGALTLDREALSLAGARMNVQSVTVQLAAHTAAAGRPEEALALLSEVLARPADPLIEARALLRHATVLRELKRPREALTDLATARLSLRRLGSVGDEFEANLELARSLRMLEEPRGALVAVERALGRSEALRLQTANAELRAQLQRPLRSAYDLKIELLRARYESALAAGRKEEAARWAAAAFGTADASRAHSFADLTAQKYPPEVRRGLAAEFRRREELYQEISARRVALAARLERSGSDDPQAKHLMSDIAELERRVDSVNTLIASRSSVESVAVRRHRERVGLPALPGGTALVSYWLGSESAYVWVISPTGTHWARLPPPAAIADKVAALHHSLSRLVDTPIERRLDDSRALYDLILRTIESWLAEVRQWVVIPDGVLDYVPFAALRMPGANSDAYVVSEHDVALAPAAWMLDTGGSTAEAHHPRELLIVADPVYQPDDPRLAALKDRVALQQGPEPGLLDGRRDYRRLPFTAREAAQISAQFLPADVDQLIGLDATRDRLLALDWSQYRFIHFATHGAVDAQIPQLSALVLSSYDASGAVVDGTVRLADLSLKTLAAEVAVFSACDTALGKEVPSEGLVGIGSTTLARGARAVVASLWPVSDEIGAQLMTEFYRHLLRDSMSAPAALGEATRSVLARDASRDPALWAAYQVYVVALGPGLPRRTGIAKAANTTKP